MYDRGKIIIGLVIFALVVIFPFLVSIGGDVKNEEMKQLDLDTADLKAKYEHCVEPADYMRANHMQILDDWRDDVVRNNDRYHVSQEYGTEYDKSLSSEGKKSCMSCHTNKSEFCDACHDYASVKPYCWTCHIEPKESI